MQSLNRSLSVGRFFTITNCVLAPFVRHKLQNVICASASSRHWAFQQKTTRQPTIWGLATGDRVEVAGIGYLSCYFETVYEIIGIRNFLMSSNSFDEIANH